MAENTIAKKEQTQSERFMNKVINEFGSTVSGDIKLTDFQKRLAQNYFMALDSVLKSTEEKRLKKSGNYQEKLPATWANVNMNKLASDVVSMARVGYDPAQPNHINLIPFKNNNTNQYDIGFIEGYRGIELKAMKYGLDVPTGVIVELVYSNDKFKPLKKDANNKYENYEFDISNPFDRGEIVGGFYYQIFNDPEKNKLVVMTKKDIEKRKPKYASPEFWGGEKTKWKNGQPDGKEFVEGWYEKMAYKTIHRAAYNDITIDSQKIDDDYLKLKQMEDDFAEAEVKKEINQNANSEVIDVEYTETKEPEEPQQEQPEEVNEEPQQDQTDGPGF